MQLSFLNHVINFLTLSYPLAVMLTRPFVSRPRRDQDLKLQDQDQDQDLNLQDQDQDQDINLQDQDLFVQDQDQDQDLKI